MAEGLEKRRNGKLTNDGKKDTAGSDEDQKHANFSRMKLNELDVKLINKEHARYKLGGNSMSLKKQNQLVNQHRSFEKNIETTKRRQLDRSTHKRIRKLERLHFQHPLFSTP